MYETNKVNISKNFVKTRLLKDISVTSSRTSVFVTDPLLNWRAPLIFSSGNISFWASNLSQICLSAQNESEVKSKNDNVILMLLLNYQSVKQHIKLSQTFSRPFLVGKL